MKWLHKLQNLPHRSRKMLVFGIGAGSALLLFTTVGLWRSARPATSESVLGTGISQALDNASVASDDFFVTSNATNTAQNATPQQQQEISEQTFLKTVYDNEVVPNEAKLLREVEVTAQKIRFNPGVTVVWLKIVNQSSAQVRFDFGTNATLKQGEKSYAPGELYDDALRASLVGLGEPLNTSLTLEPQQQKWGYLLFKPIAFEGSAQLSLENLRNAQSTETWDYLFTFDLGALQKAKDS